MTRQDYITKWLCYALGFVPVWILDAFLLPRYPVFGVSPTLLPLAVAAVAVLEGAVAGAGFGMAIGLVWELGYPNGFGLFILGMAVAGLCSGTLTQYVLTANFAGYFICSAGTLAAVAASRILSGLVIHLAPLYLLLEIAWKEFLWSIVWTPLVYVIFQFVFKRVGRDKLA